MSHDFCQPHSRAPRPGYAFAMSHGQQSLVRSILDPYRISLGEDFKAYTSHVHRVIELFIRLEPECEQLELVAIAACFHDLGVWTHETFDYIEPSLALARDHMARCGEHDPHAISQVSSMIREHHKLTRVANDPMTEAFRRADWIDLSRGWRRFGVARDVLRQLELEFPNHGFHARLLQLSIARLRTHPLSPLPMFKW